MLLSLPVLIRPDPVVPLTVDLEVLQCISGGFY
jgi:hypothetical protein